ncbi:CoA-transferase [Allorhizocola rhizosphaerae]|uniref:CoA-transferase n=1 Tax=Allorhizocola rhizosphaerae TaxID=1872709 RepID=UPI001B8C8A07|nr:CoA-transferase [Allorhizocola rhizosphaerae]
MNPIIADEPDDLIRRFIEDGMRVHITTTTGRPNALLYAMCRVFGGRRSLMVSIASIHSSAHALALSGAVKHVTTCFLGDSYPSPRPSRLYARLKEGVPFHAEIWSLLSHTQRLAAAASGLPYAVTTSLMGSHLPLATGPSPPEVMRLPGQQPSLLVPALRPEVTLLHGVIADRHGNIVMCKPFGEGPHAAYAASKGVIATVERIVADHVVAAMPQRVTIPGAKVIGLCEARWGGHPQSLRCDRLAGLPDFYLDDYRFLADAASECGSPETAQGWYRRWVEEPGGHAGYLRRLGQKRLRNLARKPQRRPLPQAGRTETPCTDHETAILLAARGIADLVRERGYRSLLAGIGAAHMAAWTAKEILSRQGIHVDLLAELGFFGFSPEPGDPFLFSQLHASRSTMTAGVDQILGNVVGSAPDTNLGVLGAVEVDATGAVNTAFLPDGRWLTGPGGANDVGTRSDCVIVAKATRSRYVPAVAHVTTPGGRVQAIYSQFGTFTRARPDELFTLSAWLPSYAGMPGSATPATLVAAHTCWEPPRRDVTSQAAITADERSILASFDPEGIYR